GFMRMPVAKPVEERHTRVQELVLLLRVERRDAAAPYLRLGRDGWRSDGRSGLARTLRSRRHGLRLRLSHHADRTTPAGRGEVTRPPSRRVPGPRPSGSARGSRFDSGTLTSVG